jgi:hypothetical protein
LISLGFSGGSGFELSKPGDLSDLIDLWSSTSKTATKAVKESAPAHFKEDLKRPGVPFFRVCSLQGFEPCIGSVWGPPGMPEQSSFFCQVLGERHAGLLAHLPAEERNPAQNETAQAHGLT